MREKCPGMSMQVVTFKNTQAARNMLRNFGGEIDIVVGVYDDAFLREYGCAGVELSREPLHCAVPLESDLAHKDLISLDDLEGDSLMLIQRGWNAEIDRLRDEVRTNHPSISIVDFPQYRAEVFNQCASEGLALVSLAVWKDVHSMLKTIPTDWGITVSRRHVRPRAIRARGRIHRRAQRRACAVTRGLHATRHKARSVRRMCTGFISSNAPRFSLGAFATLARSEDACEGARRDAVRHGRLRGVVSRMRVHRAGLLGFKQFAGFRQACAKITQPSRRASVAQR